MKFLENFYLIILIIKNLHPSLLMISGLTIYFYFYGGLTILEIYIIIIRGKFDILL